MIVSEKVKIGENEFIKTFSDSGYFIERDGEKYAEAIDPLAIKREYTETNEKIESGVDTNGVD